jgi:diguanylate cyclase (GGDEF)-like protein
MLSPFVGGDYYGAIIAGANEAAVAAGDRVMGLQTLNPGSHSADRSGVPDYRRPVSWSHLSGLVVLPGAVDTWYARAARRAGLPVVSVAQVLTDSDCSTVLADNRSGVREAVSHLIEAHGHERIAFAGNLAHFDLRERYEGYREAMLAHGRTPRPELLFDTADNHESGGETVADTLIRGGMPATAIVLGTDRNAIGLIQRLGAAGYELPRELAVVGFDDIVDAQYLRPSLSTVRQPLDRVGAVVHELLAELADDPAGPARTRHVPTFFVPRDSCGCPSTGLPVSEERTRELFDQVRQLQETLNIQHSLGIELLGAHERDPRALAWLENTPAVGGCLGVWSTTVGNDNSPDPEVTVVGEFPATRLADAAAMLTSEFPAGHLSDPAAGRLSEVPAGHLSDPAAGRLSEFPVGHLPDPAAGPLSEFPAADVSGMPVSEFPPAALFDLADGAAGELVFVVPVRSTARDWGVLAAVAAIQAATPPGREIMNQSGALLAAALDRAAMVAALREQEERLRSAALHDPLTGLPNRLLLADRLAQAGLRATREPGYQFAVLLLDLNGFKAVNDSYGHAAGDQLLIEVAHRLTALLRKSDTVARLGGDEFVVLVDGVGRPDGHRKVADAITESLTAPYPIDGNQVEVGVSIGVALSADGADPDHLLREADAAMYRAKPPVRRR